jgi:methylated-DNA-[protein]-cysteine S-methyltransferase
VRHPTWTIYQSPLGPLTLIGGPAGLHAIHFPGRAGRLDPSHHRPRAFPEAEDQLEQYFAGERTEFDLDLVLAGTGFQRRVWDELQRIPFGTTVSYLELAEAIGRADRVRAVGGAVGRTPVPIVVPCHRVLGSDGSLTGYGGGLQRKQALLDLEARVGSGLSPEPAWAFRQLALDEFAAPARS